MGFEFLERISDHTGQTIIERERFGGYIPVPHSQISAFQDQLQSFPVYLKELLGLLAKRYMEYKDEDDQEEKADHGKLASYDTTPKERFSCPNTHRLMPSVSFVP